MLLYYRVTIFFIETKNENEKVDWSAHHILFPIILKLILICVWFI
jgi:hypothetical protein